MGHGATPETDKADPRPRSEKRERPDVDDSSDETPATRQCLHGANGSSPGMLGASDSLPSCSHGMGANCSRFPALPEIRGGGAAAGTGVKTIQMGGRESGGGQGEVDDLRGQVQEAHLLLAQHVPHLLPALHYQHAIQATIAASTSAEQAAEQGLLASDSEPNGCSSQSGGSLLTQIPLVKRRLQTGQQDSIMLRSDEHAHRVLGGLQELYQDESLCDVTVRVDGEDFRAHRIVLASSSEVLRALFAGPWRERNEDIVRMDGVDRHSFRLLLHYIYAGEVRVHGLEELLTLLVAAEHVGLCQLRCLCVENLLERLDVLNSLQMYLFAVDISCSELEEAASQIVHGEFAQMSETNPDFLVLSSSQVSSIISSDRLAVDSEEEVIAAVLRWVKHDPEARIKELPALLAHVRMGLLPPQAIERLLSQEPLLAGVIRRFPACALQVDQGKQLQRLLMKDDVGGLAEDVSEFLQARPRSKRVERALLALGGRPAWTRVEKFEVKSSRWTEVAPMLNKRMRHGSSTLEGHIYVVGGKDETGRALKSLERYDPRKDKWEELEPMKVARTGLGVGALKGLLYVVGGRSEAGLRLRSTECYNVKTKQWAECPPMNEARGAVRVAALNECIYAVGGRSEADNALSSVEVFDPVSNSWSFIKAMKTARVGAGVEVLDGRLYAVGGKNERGDKLKTVERYDPGTDEWEDVADMSTKRWGAGVAVIEKRLWVIGGMNGAERGALPTLEVYDPDLNKWEEISPGPTLARGSCTFAAS